MTDSLVAAHRRAQAQSRKERRKRKRRTSIVLEDIEIRSASNVRSFLAFGTTDGGRDYEGRWYGSNAPTVLEAITNLVARVADPDGGGKP